MCLIPPGALTPKSECNDKPQLQCSSLTRDQESPDPASGSTPYIFIGSVTLCSPMFQTSSRPTSTAIVMVQGGWAGKQRLSQQSFHPSGAFYATSIYWNVCTASYFCKPENIFKHAGGGDSMEEVCVESFCKEKTVLLFKKSFLI